MSTSSNPHTAPTQVNSPVASSVALNSKKLADAHWEKSCAASFPEDPNIDRKLPTLTYQKAPSRSARWLALDECSEAIYCSLPVELLDLILEFGSGEELQWKDSSGSKNGHIQLTKGRSEMKFRTRRTMFSEAAHCLKPLRNGRTYHVEISITALRRGPAAMVKFGIGNGYRGAGCYKYFRFPPGNEDRAATATVFVDATCAPTDEYKKTAAVRLACPGWGATIFRRRTGFDAKRVFVSLSGIDGTARIEKFDEAPNEKLEAMDLCQT